MIENKLKDVPETMLITLWAKAQECKRADALLRDDKATEIISRLDYDFSRFDKAKFSQVGVCLRASLIDAEVRAYLGKHPDAVVVQLGAGLDARYERLRPMGVTHWYDLDLEEAIALRRQLLSETERNTYIVSSMFDYGWMEIARAHGKPVLIIIEGVLMYFSPEQVQAFFLALCNQLGDATVLFDMLAYSLVGRSRQHDSVQKVEGDVAFKWSLLNTKDMEAWHPNLQVEKEYYMSEHDQGRYPLLFRLLYKIPYFFRHFNQRVVRLRIG